MSIHIQTFKTNTEKKGRERDRACGGVVVLVSIACRELVLSVVDVMPGVVPTYRLAFLSVLVSCSRTGRCGNVGLCQQMYRGVREVPALPAV